MDSRRSSESEKWVDPEELSPQTRRRLLKKTALGIGGAGLAGIAGCSGQNSEGTTTTTTSGSDTTTEDDSGGTEYVDTSLDIIAKTDPQNAAFNFYSPASKYDFRWRWAQFDQLAIHDKVENQTVGMILKDWSIDGSTWNWTIRDTYKWHNGKDLTAEDVVTQLKIGQLMKTLHKGYGSPPAFDHVEQTGKYELQLDLKNPDSARDLLEWSQLKGRSWFWAYRGIWGKFADMYDDASSDEELQNARQKLSNTLKEPITDNSKVPGNSVWNHHKVEGQTLHFKPNEDYQSPLAPDHTGADIDYNLTSTYYANQQQRTQAMKEEVLDISYPPSSESARQGLRDAGWGPSQDLSPEEIQPEMRVDSMGYMFNMQDPITGKANVRKAIYHVIPRQSLVSWHTDYQNLFVADDYPTGLGQDKEVPTYGSDSWPNQTLKSFQQYAFSEDHVDTDRAAQLLKDAGYSKQSGRWHDENGEEITINIVTVPSGEEPFQLKAAQLMKAYLDKFGLKAEVTAQKESIIASKTQPDGNFHMVHFYPGAVKHGPPFFDYSTAFPFKVDMKGNNLPDRQKWGMNKKVEVPYPIGDPDGDTKTVNVYEKIRQLQFQMPDDEKQALEEEIGWIFNQTLPFITTNHEGGGASYWVNKSHWRTYDPKDDLQNPAYRYLFGPTPYSYAHLLAKVPTKWFGPKKKSE